MKRAILLTCLSATALITIAGCALLIFPLATRLPTQIQYHSEIYHGQSHEFMSRVNTCVVGENALVLIGGDYYVPGSFLGGYWVDLFMCGTI